jgi:predicted transcriptional regulator
LDSCYNYLEDIKKRIKNFKKEIDELSKKLPKNFLNKFGGCFQMIFLEEETIDKLPEKVRYTLRRLEELEFALSKELL